MPVLALTLACGCSMAEGNYADHPDQYGLYVARINIYSQNALEIRSDETGEVIAVPIHLYGQPGGYGYLEKSLKPGRYHLYEYRPYANVTTSLLTDTGYFDVQAGCFNYGGEIDFGNHDGRLAYTDSVDLTELGKLPGNLADQAASGRDVCSAPLGKPTQRFSYASIEAALNK